MKVIPLQSGSKGNCFYIESNDTRLLIDAGISPRQTVLRLASHERDIENVDCLLLTHDHSDHSRYVDALSSRFGLPVYLTSKTREALHRQSRVNGSDDYRCFVAGDSLNIGALQVHSIPTPHDAADGVAYVIEDDQYRVGILTDLGHPFDGLRDVLNSLDAVVLESNYDETLLENGSYPEFLKRRIRGPGGHLSNLEAAQLVHHHAGHKLQWVCLCHLSGENNCPDVAIRTHQNWLGDDCPIFIAERHTVSRALNVG